MPEIKATVCDLKFPQNLELRDFTDKLNLSLKSSVHVSDRIFSKNSKGDICEGSHVILSYNYNLRDKSLFGVFGIVGKKGFNKVDTNSLENPQIDINQFYKEDDEEEAFKNLLPFCIKSRTIVVATTYNKNLHSLALNLSQLSGYCVEIEKKIDSLNSININNIRKIEINADAQICKNEDIDAGNSFSSFSKLFPFFNDSQICKIAQMRKYATSTFTIVMKKEYNDITNQLQGILQLVDEDKLVIYTKDGHKIVKNRIDTSKLIKWISPETQYFDYDSIYSEMILLF